MPHIQTVKNTEDTWEFPSETTVCRELNSLIGAIELSALLKGIFNIAVEAELKVKHDRLVAVDGITGRINKVRVRC